jgi:hypothetical protein
MTFDKRRLKYFGAASRSRANNIFLATVANGEVSDENLGYDLDRRGVVVDG